MKSYSFTVGETLKAFSKLITQQCLSDSIKTISLIKLALTMSFTKGSISLGFKSNDAPWIVGGKTYSRVRGNNLHQATKLHNPLYLLKGSF